MHIPHLIVGAGPVGLILGHYFKKFNIPFQILEKQSKLSAHPSAHYLNMRTMEILNELNIKLPFEDLQQFKNYVYLRRIGEQPLNITNQLIDYKKYTYAGYGHLPQNLFVQQVSQGIQDKIQLNQEIKKIEILDNKIKINDQITCDYLYGCDGLNGFVRDNLKIKLIGNRDVQRFLNVHFTSKQLVKQLDQYKSMLTFIYNSDITAVIIKHRIEDGTFAIQIPLDLLTGKTDSQDVQHLRQDHILIKNLINKALINGVSDIDVKSVGFWRMGAVYAENYVKGNCVLVGDACHGMPPAGGFGMNTGIQDAHNLAYKILEKKDLKYYEQERQQIAKDNINTALKYYQKSLDIAKQFTFDINKLKMYQSIMKYTPDFIYQTGVKLGGSLIEMDPIYKRIQVKDHIPLVFPKEEIEFKYEKGDLGINGGQLAPLVVREVLNTKPREWYSINCDNNMGYQRVNIQGCNSMIVRKIDTDTLPEHDQDRFRQFYEIDVDGKRGFKLVDGTIFLLDNDGGWQDEKGCYYDGVGQPSGWYVIFNGIKYFYSLDGFFIPYSRNPQTLPKHQTKINITNLDYDQNFLDNDGCYYDKFGEPLGWKIKCEDGQVYFFDMNGDYVEILAGEEKNDLNDFDMDEFKYDFRTKSQFIKQNQQQRPKFQPVNYLETKKQNPAVQQSKPDPKLQQQQPSQQQQKPQQFTKQQQEQSKQVNTIKQQTQSNNIQNKNTKQQQPTNKNPQHFQYQFELPDDNSETRKMVTEKIKEVVIPKPEFILNNKLLTVKCDKAYNFLDYNIVLDNGKVAQVKK